MAANGRTGHPGPRTAPQSFQASHYREGARLAAHPAAAMALFPAVILGVPALAFAAGLVLLGRYQRMLRVVAAGQRTTD